MNSLILLLVRLVFRRLIRASFCNFFYSFLNTYRTQNLCSTMFQASSRNFIWRLFSFVHAAFPVTSVKYFAKCRSLIWKTCFRTFQYSSVLFDNRIELNSGLKAIVEMTRSNISSQLHAKLPSNFMHKFFSKLPSNFMHCGACQTTLCTSFLANCQATSCTVELAKQLYAQAF